VKEIGNVFRRLLHFLDCVDPDEIVMLSKIDLSDGFWRMLVEEEAKWNFAYVLPGPPDSPIQLVVPSALQMGWAESPAYFCAATETARDIIHQAVETGQEFPEHVFEEYMNPTKKPKRSTKEDSMYSVSVYLDDFIGAAVENASGTLLGRVTKAALHGIHSIFPPPDITGHVGGKDPISLKKLQKGDARWASEKEILGFLVDGEAKTVRISDAKAKDIVAEIRKILKKKRVQLKRYRRIVGKLRHVALILPGTKGLFSPINKALRGDPAVIGLGKSSEVRAALLDLATMVTSLSSRPTHVKELIPNDDHYYGYCDACATGAGGVWLSGERGIDPIVWRVEFDNAIASQVVSDDNPHGRLTNSDLEMAAVLLQYIVLQQEVDMQFARAGVLSDNTPTVAWTTRMADKSQSPTAGRLLRGLAAMQRASQAGPLTVASIAGVENSMADVASRSFGQNRVPDTCFLAQFTNSFPLPQQQSWRHVHLMPETISLVTSTLHGKRLPLQQWMTGYKPKTGTTGWNSARMPDGTLTSKTAPPLSNNTSSSGLLHGTGEATTVEAFKLALKPQKPRSVTWPKPLSWQATPIPAAPTVPPISTSPSPGC
jgi:hypothetical protein